MAVPSATFEQSRCDDVEGLCPWPPASLPDAERRVWMEGLRWETRHFHDQLLAPFADWMSHKTKVQRAEALFRVLQVFSKEGGISFFHRCVLVVDRLLLTSPSRQLLEDLGMDVAVAAVCFLRASQLTSDHRDHQQLAVTLRDAMQLPPAIDLQEVAAHVEAASLCHKWMADFHCCVSMLHSPRDWFLRLTPACKFPLSQDKVDLLFTVVAVDGSLAHHPPSSVAAAMMVFLFGEAAEPYMCGYDVIDVSVAVTEIERICTQHSVSLSLAMQDYTA